MHWSCRTSTSTTRAARDFSSPTCRERRCMCTSAPAPSFDLEKNLETFRHLLALKPRALLFSHYGPHGKPKAAIEAMMALYPSWDRVVKERLASTGEDGVLRELYDMSCRAAKRF